MTETLPVGVQSYRRTATFTETTIPAGLLKDHSTKKDTWALIHILMGQLRYVVTDPRRPSAERVLTVDQELAVVEPTILHRVEPLGPARFYVEFLRPGKQS